jgi:molybdopterin-guanine dinucleotide biosynthesis protein A
MGRSKIDLPFAGSTFLDLVVAAARPVFDEVVMVGRSESAAVGGGAPLRVMIEPAHGEAVPVYGVMRALADTGGKAFIIAVDYPLITTEILRFLRLSFEKTAAPMLVPVWREKAQMLCAGYSASLLPVLERRVGSGRLDLRGLIEEAGAEMIVESVLRERFSGEPLMNVNTPEELEEARDRYGR